MIVETRVKEPIIPMSLFKSRTFSLVIVASVAIGVALFGTSVFLSQYMQLSRGKTPTEAGLYTLPLVLGLLLSSTIVGAIISRRGKWKSWMILGASLLTVGLALMGTVRYDTNIFLLFGYMALMGFGARHGDAEPGARGAELGGCHGDRHRERIRRVSPQPRRRDRRLRAGAILANRVAELLKDGLSALGVPASQSGGLSGGTIPVLSTLPAPIRTLVESSYGKATGEIFLVATPLALIALIAIIFLPNVQLGSKTGIQQLAEKGELAEPATTTGAVRIRGHPGPVGVEEIGGNPSSEFLEEESPAPRDGVR